MESGGCFGVHPLLEGNKMINYNRILAELPGITVIMIDTGRNDKWFKEATASVLDQVYPLETISDGNHKTKIELKIANNRDKKYTIGQCWNYLIKEAEFDHIFILDDDDMMEKELLLNMMLFLQRIKLEDKNKDIIGVTPNVTFMEKKDGKMYYQFSDSYTSGLIEKEWLLKIPFREELEKHVDMRWDDDILKKGKYVAVQNWNHGYLYRQHDGMVSGRNVDMKFVDKDLNRIVDIEVK